MANNPIPQSEIDEAVRLVAECGGNVKLAAKKASVEYNRFYARYRRKNAKRELKAGEIEPTHQWTEANDNAAFSGVFDKPIRTEEQLLKACGVDKNVWEVKEWGCGAWTTTMKLKVPGEDGEKIHKPHQEQNFKVWAKFKRKYPKRLENAIDGLLERISRGAPVIKVPKSTMKTEPHMLEIAVHDLHFGKLAWREECSKDYDLRIAGNLFRAAIEEHLENTRSFNLEKIVLPVGSDLLHIDGPSNTTTAGTPQDSDSRWAKIYATAMAAMIWAIEKCLTRAPVELYWVPGNHDYVASWWLSRVIQSHFRLTKAVTVDCTPTPRKYIRYGVVLLGMTHGSEERHADLPAIMAAEQPEAWSTSTVREWHCGHFHRSKETRFSAGDTYGGVGVRILKSLSSHDFWHVKKGYVGEHRGCEAFLWGKQHGLRAVFNSYPSTCN